MSNLIRPWRPISNSHNLRISPESAYKMGKKGNPKILGGESLCSHWPALSLRNFYFLVATTVISTISGDDTLGWLRDNYHAPRLYKTSLCKLPPVDRWRHWCLWRFQNRTPSLYGIYCLLGTVYTFMPCNRRMTHVGQFAQARPGLREGPICSESSQSYKRHSSALSTQYSEQNERKPWLF